jgi:hypothetical protein
VVQEISLSPCVKGQSWGFKPGIVWVNNGCRARFFGLDRAPETLTCRSENYGYRYCPYLGGRGGSIDVTQRISAAECKPYIDFGADDTGIWVNNGCGAVFEIYR